MDSKPCLSFPLSQSIPNGKAPAHSWSERIWRRLVETLQEKLDANTDDIVQGDRGTEALEYEISYTLFLMWL
jgi:hypothetical protein